VLFRSEYTLTDKEPDDWKFVEALIAYGFNSVRFSAYVCGQIRSDIKGLGHPETKLALKKYRKHVQQIPLQTLLVYSTSRPPIVNELVDWIEAEIDYGLAANPLKRTASMKLNTTMKGSQLSFWNKLQYDHGIYEEDNLEIFSEKVAHNFTSKGKEDLSPSSIKSKLYSKDLSVIDPVESLL